MVSESIRERAGCCLVEYTSRTIDLPGYDALGNPVPRTQVVWDWREVCHDEGDYSDPKAQEGYCFDSLDAARTNAVWRSQP